MIIRFLYVRRIIVGAVFLLVAVAAAFHTVPQPPPKSVASSSSSSSFSSTAAAASPILSQHERKNGSPLSWTLDEFADVVGGSGRAKACWECFRLGVDPLWYYGTDETGKENKDDELEPMAVAFSVSDTVTLLEKGQHTWTRKQVEENVSQTSSRGSPTQLGKGALQRLKSALGGGSIETTVASLTNMTTSSDGTTKLLLELKADGMLVETVIIPWDDRQKSTICVSSQVGCRQACTFCSTGRMGLLRNLSSTEILAQLYWANKICRRHEIYAIDNCVFMGMGEPADNIDAVVSAATAMVDRNLFQLAPRRVTISTVAPNPDVFAQLGAAPVVLAWSVHASRDDLRRQLVPTSQHTMEELREGLLSTLKGRSKRLRNIMLEVALLDQINDSVEDAEHLAEFCRPLLEQIQGLKLVVNLIPWNDISATFGPASLYRKPKMDRVLAYQNTLVERGILSYIRTTRGDEEDAACGMLSTKSKRTK